jgi:hypothetical protein
MVALGSCREDHPLRGEDHDTVPAVAVLFGLVFLIFAGAVYSLHSLMKPTILKHRGISYSSPARTNAVTPQTQARQAEIPRQERQVKKRVHGPVGPSYGYGAPL